MTDNGTWYRKYRPENFADVVGQKDTITILKNSINEQRYVHAYLFSGPKGIGKTSVAKIFAKNINCLKQNLGESCRKCQSCLSIAKTTDHLDIIEIDGASNNGVDEIRNIRKNINILPMDLKFKVYIIDEVHMLTTPAFNALLKTLEEPPAHIFFIFATTEPQKIPETVVSRTQWFAFEKIAIIDMVMQFTKILEQEKIFFKEDALLEIALLANGSLRDGINKLQQLANFAHEINIENVKQLFNITSVQTKVNFLIALFNQEVTILMTEINKLQSINSDFKKVIVELLNLLIDITIYHMTKNIDNTKFLVKEQLEYFIDVNLNDLQKVLLMFENLLTSNLESNAIMTVFISKIINADKLFTPYHLENKLTNIFVTNKNEQKVINEQINIEYETKLNNKNEIENTEIKTSSIIMATNNDDKKNHNENNVEETVIEKQIVITNQKPVDQKIYEPIINVLVQADSKQRKLVKNYWIKTNELITNNKFRNFSKFYLNTNIAAASDNALILICENQIQAETITYKFNTVEHRAFLNYLLKKEFMIYAIDRQCWKNIGRIYQSLLEAKQLPDPVPIKIPVATINEKDNEKNITLRFLQKFFKEVEEI